MEKRQRRGVRETREKDAKGEKDGIEDGMAGPPTACPERSRRVAKDAKAKRGNGTRECGEAR